MSDKSPDAFRTISEVADWLGVQPHVLRFWESKFSQVRPVKRAGGRRYYRPNDMLLLGGIRKLLHEDGLTIKGAQKVLREEGMAHVASLSQPLDAESAALSDLAAAAEERAAVSQPEETGQVLDFEAARPEAEPPQPHSETPDPVAEPQTEQPASADASDTVPPAHAEPPEMEDSAAQPTPEPQRESAHAPGDTDSEEEPARSPLPSFMRDPSTRKPPAPEPSGPNAAEPDQPDTAPDEAASTPAASDRLPSFLKSRPAPAEPPTPGPEAEETAAEDASATTAAAGPEGAHGTEPVAPDAAAEPETQDTPQPQVIDVPDPDESSFEVAASALSVAFTASRLSGKQRAELLPLVAQLAALRDRMAAAQER